MPIKVYKKMRRIDCSYSSYCLRLFVVLSTSTYRNTLSIALTNATYSLNKSI